MRAGSSGAEIDIGMLMDAGRMSGLQRRVIALCCTATFLDGYDTQALGLAVPLMSESWGLPPSSFPSVVEGLTEDGLIAEHWESVDWVSAYQSFGLLPDDITDA